MVTSKTRSCMVASRVVDSNMFMVYLIVFQVCQIHSVSLRGMVWEVLIVGDGPPRDLRLCLIYTSVEDTSTMIYCSFNLWTRTTTNASFKMPLSRIVAVRLS